ncbi:hypothetical protein F4677DRAFT_225444 [Hypoxylon crocopeplum]|nr:hypothetical protein F4677DRAFT_225444 [Hypoxylon crocopeplum]
MAGCTGGFRAFTARLQKFMGVKTKPTPSEKAPLQISAPFNFKHETVSLPGVSEDEIAVLKHQAALATHQHRYSYTDPLAIGNPRKAPSPPVLKVTPSSPISPADNLI